LLVVRYRISSCDVIWVIKDKSIVSTFVDAGAAKFFMPQLGVDAQISTAPVKRKKYQLDGIYVVQYVFVR